MVLNHHIITYYNILQADITTITKGFKQKKNVFSQSHLKKAEPSRTSNESPASCRHQRVV